MYRCLCPLNSILLAGHSVPAGPRENRRYHTRTHERSDGRAPDTAATLEIATISAGPNGVLKKVFQPHGRFATSYTWNGSNSCFIDSTLEVVFRAFALWDDVVRTHFLDRVQNTSFLGKLMWRLSRRLTQMTDTKSPDRFFITDLELMQLTILDFASAEQLILPNQYACSMSWFSKGILVRQAS